MARHSHEVRKVTTSEGVPLAVTVERDDDGWGWYAGELIGWHAGYKTAEEALAGYVAAAGCHDWTYQLVTQLGPGDAMNRRKVVVRRPGKPDIRATLVFWPIPADERDPVRNAEHRRRTGAKKNRTGTKARVEFGPKPHQISVPTEHVFPE